LDKYTKHVPWIVEHFPLISGIAIFLWWSAVRIKRSIFSGYPTNLQMDERFAMEREYHHRNAYRMTKKIDLLVERQAENAAASAQESIDIREIMLAHSENHKP
jgi:hypothetical protein